MFDKKWLGGLAFGLVAGLVLWGFVVGWLSGGLPDWLHHKDVLVRTEDTLANWLVAFFSIVAAVLLWRTLHATQEMAKHTRRIGEAQVRAYLTVEDASVTPEISGAGIVFWHLMFTVRNSGQSPASKVIARASGQLFASDGHSVVPDLASGGDFRASLILSTDGDDLRFIDSDQTKTMFASLLTIRFNDVFTVGKERRTASIDIVGIVHVVNGEASNLVNAGTAITEKHHVDD